MSMMNTGDILETIEMFTQDNLDVRTVTMGISLLDCIDPDPKKACEKVYNKIVTKAANLVPAVEHISAEYGIPIINKRISVTPIAMLLGACPDADPVDFAKALDAAGKKVGVNFVGGYTALVHKGFSAGDPNVNLQDVMVNLQKANLSFQQMVQVRNKLVTAYQDIMNMSV